MTCTTPSLNILKLSSPVVIFSLVWMWTGSAICCVMCKLRLDGILTSTITPIKSAASATAARIPANTRHSACVGAILGQRRRRWLRIAPTQGEPLPLAPVRSPLFQTGTNILVGAAPWPVVTPSRPSWWNCSFFQLPPPAYRTLTDEPPLISKWKHAAFS